MTSDNAVTTPAARRLYGIHCARVRAEGCDPASAPVMVLGVAS